jgi:hypothetical protein
MDVNTIKAIGALPSPTDPYALRGKARSVAMNSFGTVVLLDDRGRVHYSDARSQLKVDSVKLLPVEGGQAELEIYKFTHCVFHDNGMLLLLYSLHHVGVIEIPRGWTASGNDISGCLCRFYCCSGLDSQLANNRDAQTNNGDIALAEFYPHSNIHVVVLFSSCLMVIDLVLFTHQRIPLSVDHTFVSFCFGPSGLNDWLTFTVFLLDRDGSIFSLCPVLPRGARVDASLISSLHGWLDERVSCLHDRFCRYEQYETNGSDMKTAGFRSEVNDVYLQSVKQFLGSVGLASGRLESSIDVGCNYEQNDNKDSKYDHLMLTNGGSIDIDYDSIPLLQGPLVKTVSCTVRPTGRSKAKATDIAVPKSTGRGEGASPVIAVVFEDGIMEMLLIAVEVRPR